MAVFKENQAFQINDIIFSVGPSNIQVQKENLSYRWHVLRQGSSTKIPTAHGGCIANVRIPIPREDVLKLHRLIVQFKQNPFAYIENKYLRDEIVPHWPSHQSMAFTLVNMNVESVTGNVGLFIVDLQMQWFNYFPYTHNFLFREEWQTDWIQGGPAYLRKSIYGYLTATSFNAPSDAHVKATAGDLEKTLRNWQGFIFDLLPIPSGMSKSNPVKDPRQSKIFVRFFNELQANALNENFGINLHDNIWLGEEDYYNGLLSGDGGQYKGSSVTLPEYLSRKGKAGDIIAEMLSHDAFKLSFNTYKFVDIPPTIKEALGSMTNPMISSLASASSSDPLSGLTVREVDVTSKINKISKTYYKALMLAEGKIPFVYDDFKGGKINIASYSDVIGTPTIGIGHAIQTSGERERWKNYLIVPGKKLTEQEMITLYDHDLAIREIPLAAAITAPVTQEMFDALFSYVFNAGMGDHGVRTAIAYINKKDYINAAQAIANGTATSKGEFKQFLRDRRIKESKEFLYGGIPSALSVLSDGAISIPSGPSASSGSSLGALAAAAARTTIPSSTSTSETIEPSDVERALSDDEVKALLPPWYDVLAKISGSFTEADQNFFSSLRSLVDVGYISYTADPTINGVFYKKAEISIRGHGSFSGMTDSHNTILTKVQGTLRHIIAALPILGQEFPTHQHLGSTDATYSFEFATLDHKDDRSGMGSGARMLEAARIALQQNGRSIRNIYDCWMARGDNFLTRLLGTCSHTQDTKKIIIASTQAATLDGSPGTSVLVLNCEETLSFVNEELTKVTQATRGDYEEIYRKIVSKMKTIVKAVTSGPEKPRWHGPIGGIFGPLDPRSSLHAMEYVTGDFFDLDRSKFAPTDLNTPFYILDTDKLTDIVEEDKKELALLIVKTQYLFLLGQLILIEESKGGLPQVAGDYTPIDYDLYGAEIYVIPVGSKLMDRAINNWGPFANKVKELQNKSWNILNIVSLSIPESALRAAEVTPTIIPVASYFRNGVPAFEQEVMTFAYLLEILQYTNDFSTFFVSSTVDFAVARVNKILPVEVDGSPLLKEHYGLLSSLDRHIENVSNGLTAVGPSITEKSWETNKIELIKSQLTETLQSLLDKPNMLKFFGIEEAVAALAYKVIRDEKDALPDLTLPAHPFWGKTYLTPPDFYYYNYHEDGVYTSDGYALYKTLSNAYVDGVHSFMDKWITDGMKVDISGNYTAGEVQESSQVSYGAAFDGFNNEITDEFNTTGISRYGLVSKNPKSDAPEDEKADTIKFFPEVTSTSSGKIASPFQPSNFDRDVLYVPIATPDLIERIKGIEFQFGRKEGYANEREEIAKITSAPIAMGGPAQDTAFTHFYGASDLKSIVDESKKDIISQKFTMKRAFPTFRLYFIEEDQTEDFLIRYDDFYHYNAIKDITIVRNRKIAGDTAVIVMQNIAGILDGSKRAVLKDTDFLTSQRNPDGTLTAKGKEIEESRRIESRDTKEEEVFGSVVLRPGVNMQLRTGYSNDPSNLEVKLSGRVIDVAFSENSDLVEITIQSFGVELEQVSKGLDPNQSDTYDLTHKLLGALMLSPELIHFGRWEVGTQYQFGEFKDSTLDFRRYASNEIWQKITGVYFANTWKQIGDLRKVFTDRSFFAHFTVGNDSSLIGTGLSKATMTPALVSASVKVAGASTWDSATSIHRLAFRTTKKFLTKKVIEKKAYVFSSPQDDNIYAPDPKDYILRPNWGWPILEDVVKDILNRRYIPGLTKGILELVRGFTSQKLALSDLTYILDNVTIWQVFHEMTLRHPNYVYTPIPYGKEFRYTMFFGVPSQRYWSKPAHPYFISRVNSIRKDITSVLGGGSSEVVSGTTLGSTTAAIIARRKALVKDDAIKAIGAIANGTSWGLPPPVPIPFSTSSMSTTTGGTLIRDEATMKAEFDKQIQLLENLRSSKVREDLLEYYLALTLRFEPFRRYHMATSETDIISNNISISEYNVANTIAVKYFSNGLLSDTDRKTATREQEGIAIVKMHDRIPDEEIRLMRLPDYPNVGSKLLALRYAVGQLVYEAKEMYSGSLLLVGNPRIKPWDICFAENTMVHMKDGYKEIQNILHGDQVLTHSGNYEGVTKISKHSSNDKMLQISITGEAESLRVTENHPFLVIYPSDISFKDRKNIIGLEKRWVPSKYLRYGDYLLTPIEKPQNDISQEMATLIGYFLAEGNFIYENRSKGRIRVATQWTFNLSNEAHLYDIFVELTNKLGIRNPKKYECEGKNSLSIIIYSRKLADKLYEYCGEHSHEKELKVFPKDEIALKKLLAAYFDGDGCQIKTGPSRGTLQAITASYKLARSIQKAGLMVKIPLLLGQQPCSKSVSSQKYKQSHKYYYSLKINGFYSPIITEFSNKYECSICKTKDNSMCFISDNYLVRPIKSIKEIITPEYVYNIEVNKDHSYVVDGIAVHNCFIVDKYNDICGPIEVEQVVERISFDTGYITEIKPNAVVFANEISSFPVLEGLKAFVSARTTEQDSLYTPYVGNDYFNDLLLSGYTALETVDNLTSIGFLHGRHAKDLASFTQTEISGLIGVPQFSSSTPVQSHLASLAWLIGGYLYIYKCLDNQSVMVYPLLKNGLPLIAGLPSAQTETLWSITFGQINSFIDDVARGTVEYISRWKLLGYGAITAFTKDSFINKKVATAASSLPSTSSTSSPP